MREGGSFWGSGFLMAGFDIESLSLGVVKPLSLRRPRWEVSRNFSRFGHMTKFSNSDLFFKTLSGARLANGTQENKVIASIARQSF
jgi:hypothetical protein